MSQPDRLYRALGDKTRLRILQHLHAHGMTCVCELVQPLGLPQSTVSSHLRTLREAGLVTTEKIGRWVFYGMSSDGLAEAIGWLQGNLDPVKCACHREPAGLYAACLAGKVPASFALAEPEACCQD
ncbi:MAG: helix-turn-helix transcriptional regulator [Armatimonadetes bacterium]|nr:helix-turn-helix transcriptional regulator [Armatimonadota bacterium]